MKSKLPFVLLLVVVMIQSKGLATNFPWEGIIVWTITVVLLLMAAYFTKYMPSPKKDM